MCNRWECFSHNADGTCRCLKTPINKNCPFFKTIEEYEHGLIESRRKLMVVNWNDETHRRMREISKEWRDADE